jgi:hypothetical protein
MKLEFIADGSLDCPLIRIYDFDSLAACRLQNVFSQLASRKIEFGVLDELLEMETVDNCRVAIQVGKYNRGVLINSQKSDSFVWILNPITWDNVAGLIEPFCQSNLDGFQWLDQTSGISVLLSPSGTW